MICLFCDFGVQALIWGPYHKTSRFFPFIVVFALRIDGDFNCLPYLSRNFLLF